MKTHACLLAIATIAGAARAQFLLSPEPNNDKVMQFSAVDGSLINPAYIDLAPLTTTDVCVDALQVNNEIWISNLSADVIYRFSLDGLTHLGTVSGGMNNIGGMAFDGTKVYVSNRTGAPGPGTSLVMWDPTGAPLGFFPVGDPSDVILYQGDLLVANLAGDDIDRYTTAGVFVGTFHNSDGITGIDDPLQLALKTNGNLLAGGFSPPAGLYEYDSAGTQVFVHPVPFSGIRGVTELGNGNLIYSDPTGVYVRNPIGATTTNITSFQCRFFAPFTGNVDPTVAFCAGDGIDPNVTTPCPCANPGSAGNGCGNSVNPSGANLTVSGIPNPDSMVLIGSGMPAVVSCIYLQGDSVEDLVFGDGVRCAGGNLIRLRTKANVGGASQFPDSTDTVSLSVRGGVTPGTGTVRYYQTYYRNSAAAFCPPETFNVTSGWIIHW